MKSLLVIWFTIVTSLGFSHKGKVVDSSGNPLPMASIEIPEKGIITYTDIYGNYEINVPEGTEVIIRYISYETKKVTSQEGLCVKLEDISLIKED